MPRIVDFRRFHFDQRRIDRCGKHIGRQAYWKLYSIENLVRIFIHSILAVQIDLEWWSIAVDPTIQRKAERFRRQYTQSPSQTSPGQHDIHYTFLSDLNKIISGNSNLFIPIIPDVDKWMIRLERIRLPRNIVGHMNFPHLSDIRTIDVTHTQFAFLLPRIEEVGIEIVIPK